ncbi:nucleoside permease [Pseudomaricurvus alkylphenolicus]|uniref:nucleoside permease n=1 Tax=Pseudomaricurvus alkylphenolicus TaxID=1306991 RepID=UPI00141E7BF7|nr:nucleoside permease [Pseudomaricurvus alkylphenolicus]NIB38225.1 nucleoside permease [Pseudomaricurvus alkylphenolicus]
MSPLHIRLSGMMFLQFFIWGAWFVTLGSFLGRGLGVGGTEIGMAYGTTAIAAMVSPLLVGALGDRWLPPARLLAILHLLGAVLLWYLAQTRSFDTLYMLLMAYALLYMPTLALANTVCFQGLADGEREFPKIRVFGTLGWIAAGILVGFLAIEETATPFVLAAVSSLILGIYCFTLPDQVRTSADTPAANWRQLLGLDALALLNDRSLLLVFVCSLLICIPLAFYYNFTNLYLNDLGIENAAGKMTLGQVSEVLFMLLMPLMFRRLGIKAMLMIGMGAWVIRYGLFAYGFSGEGVNWSIYLGILLHGICYDFFFVSGQIYTDRVAPRQLRGSAQALLTFCTYGVGMFIGAYASGWIVSSFTTEQRLWEQIWLAPAVMALLVLCVFALLFKDSTTETEQQGLRPAGEQT